jgi:hypothetical protein
LKNTSQALSKADAAKISGKGIAMSRDCVVGAQ